MDESETLAHDVEALAAEVQELEAQLEAREAHRHELSRLQVHARRLWKGLAPDEGPLGGEAATTAWRLVVAVVGWVLVIAGAYGLSETLGSAAIVAALAFFITEAAA